MGSERQASKAVTGWGWGAPALFYLKLPGVLAGNMLTVQTPQVVPAAWRNSRLEQSMQSGLPGSLSPAGFLFAQTCACIDASFVPETGDRMARAPFLRPNRAPRTASGTPDRDLSSADSPHPRRPAFTQGVPHAGRGKSIRGWCGGVFEGPTEPGIS